MSERLWPDVLLAAAVLNRAVAGLRVVEAQVMGAPADGLWLRRRREGGSALLGQLALGLDDPQSPRVVPLHGATNHRGDDEDQPPVAAHEVRQVVHGANPPAFERVGATRPQVSSGRSASTGNTGHTGTVAGGRIEAVVFDLGGVLIDWDPRHVFRSVFDDQAEMEDFLARVCTPDWHRAHDLGADVRESCERLAGEHPGYRDAIMVWADRYEEMAAGQFDETVDVLADVVSAGLPCYAISNMEPDTFRVRYDRFPFMRWFDGCVISGIERVAKPDRRIFEILLARHRLDPAATVYVDDMAANVAIAGSLGMTALRFTSARQLRLDLRPLIR